MFDNEKDDDQVSTDEAFEQYDVDSKISFSEKNAEENCAIDAALETLKEFSLEVNRLRDEKYQNSLSKLRAFSSEIFGKESIWNDGSGYKTDTLSTDQGFKDDKPIWKFIEEGETITCHLQ